MVRKSWIQEVCVGIALCAARYVTLWFIIGSFHLFFSGTTVVAPLAGLYTAPSMLSLWFLASIMRFCMQHTFTFSLQLLSVYHIPTQVAAWYWQISQEKATSTGITWTGAIFAIIPLLCMALFIMHPVGWYAAPYTLYWFIPSVIVLYAPKNRWLLALGSTFTAHAVGSVLWIWTHPGMSSAMWMCLIPIVGQERFVIATAMWATSYVIDLCLEKIPAVLTAGRLVLVQLMGSPREVAR